MIMKIWCVMSAKPVAGHMVALRADLTLVFVSWSLSQAGISVLPTCSTEISDPALISQLQTIMKVRIINSFIGWFDLLNREESSNILY